MPNRHVPRNIKRLENSQAIFKVTFDLSRAAMRCRLEKIVRQHCRGFVKGERLWGGAQPHQLPITTAENSKVLHPRSAEA